MGIKKLLTVAALLAAGGLTHSAWAQTDVTSTYLNNADFEGSYSRFLDINTDGRGVEKPLGWSVEWYQDNNDTNGMTYIAESMTQDDNTWNAYSGKSYFARMRWGNATIFLRQTLQNLRPGNYTLTFYATAYTTNNANSVKVSVAGKEQIINFANEDAANWTQYSVNFTVTENTPYATIEYKAERTGDLLKVGLDEFVLTYDGSSYYETIVAKAEAVYNDNKDWATNGLSDFENAIAANKGKASIADINTAIFNIESAISTYKSNNSTDLTAKISNPNFDSNINSWTCTGGDGNAYQFQNSVQENFTGGFLEKWRYGWTGSYNQADFNVSQEINNLPNGEYTVKAYILAQMQGAKETLDKSYKDKKHGGPYYIDDNKGVWMYASSGENTSNTWANSFTPNFGDISGGVLRSATVTVTNGTLTIGFKGIGSQSGGTTLGSYANWIACDTWTLSYFGFDPTTLLSTITTLKADAEELLESDVYANVIGEERTNLNNAYQVNPNETKTELEEAINNLETAISAFTAAKTNYDNLVAEIAKAKALGIEEATANSYAATASSTSATALENTQALKVDEYNYVTTDYSYNVELGSWNTTGPTGSKSEQHYSGENKPYLEQSGAAWGESSWTIKYEQDLTLPAGEYVFKVAGRRAAGSGNTLSLNVSIKDGDVLGTVNDFPEGDTGFGINKAGVTSFNSADEAGFANENNGRGWEWRYVKFELASESTVTVAVNANATTNHQWVSFCDATVQTNNEANIATIAYNIAKNDANLALNNDTYSVVTGSERTALQEAINANPGTTTETINAAIEALANAKTAFTNAKASYDDLIAAKNEKSAELPYASADKYTSLNAAADAEPTSAEDAVTKAAAIRTANRLYVESNAMAEGVEGAVNMTSYITNPNFTVEGVGSDEGWSSSQSGGNKGVIDNEPLTDGNGVTHRYYDYWNGSANNQHVTQVVENLPAGRYIFTVSARADVNLNNVFVKIGDKQSAIIKIGSTGGTFGRGWNDCTVVYDNDKAQNVTLEIYSTSEGGNKSGWFGFTRARLVKIAEAANMSISEAQYGTFVAPFDVEIPAGVTASKITGVDANGVTLIEETVEGTIPANTPVILFSEAVVNTTFYGTAETGTAEAGLLTGNLSGETINAPLNSYILLNGANGVGFYRVVTEDVTVKNNRVYLTVPAAQAKAFFSFGGGATGINGIEGAEGATEVVRFNAAGVQVAAPVKGLNIVKMSDGTVKKVMVK